jgi:hypothetical protein
MEKKGFLYITLFSILLLSPIAWASSKPADASLNARFVNWQEMPHVVHLFVYPDAGRPGHGLAEASSGQPIIFGFEYGGESVEWIYENIIHNEEYDITVSVEGGDPFSVKDGFGEPFVAETRIGPRWSWDHDGDGPGDEDADGIDDWAGPVVFFRYMEQGYDPGVHTFTFTVIDEFGSLR